MPTQDPGLPRRIAYGEVGGEVAQVTLPPPTSKSEGEGTCNAPGYHSDDDDSDQLPPPLGQRSNGVLEFPPRPANNSTDTVTAKQLRVETPP